MSNLNPTEDLGASVQRTLLEEARRNELTVAYVRGATLLMVSILDWFAYLFPKTGVHLEQHSVTIPFLSSGWLLLSVVIAAALARGRYRPGMRYWLPLMDGVFVFLLYGNFLRTVGPELFVNLGQLTAVGVTSALLAASGALRLTRKAAILTTGLALANYATLSLLSISWSSQVLLGLAVLLGTGLLSVRMTRVVRRAVESEIGRNTLSRFLPERVIADAHKDPLALITKPESVDATILVSDLRGFTSMSEKMDPVAVLELLNDVQGDFASAVRQHGGIVDKFMGDGMLAVFKRMEETVGPSQTDDHARNALKTYHQMMEMCETINRARQEKNLQTIRIGVGIHTGNVVTGCLGSGARLEFTVLGDTVNTASRLESLTKEKKVTLLASAATVASAGDLAADMKPIGEVAIRGRNEPLMVYTVD